MAIRLLVQIEIPLDGPLTTSVLGAVARTLLAVLGDAGAILIAEAGDEGHRVLTIEGTAEREAGGL